MGNKHTLFSLAMLALLMATFLACSSKPKRLPILGEMDIKNGDTLFHAVPDMVLVDQDSQSFQLSKLGNKVVVADFFFTSCPSICPRVKKQMLRLYDKYKNDDRVMFVSHTIDPRHDSTTVLKRYAHNLGVNTVDWKFVTGDKDSIFTLADQYFVSVVDDPSAPSGFDHSGRIILVDNKRHVRGYCDGTDPKSVDGFFATIDELLHEQYAQ
ncbi:MAG TPA: SCO family protein [Saprospiraceae bacterium]|nr:SCO family protein [Saprospiraceae bacterium]